jgi:DNA-binding XRE family transcriptional regulator
MIVFTFFLLARLKMQGGSDSLSVHVSILASGVKRLFRYCFRVPMNKLHDAISSQVACLLKEEREKRGLSLNVLAQKAGVSRQTVSYVEQEVQNPTLDTLLRITAVLEVDLEKIIAKARKAAAKQE